MQAVFECNSDRVNLFFIDSLLRIMLDALPKNMRRMVLLLREQKWNLMRMIDTTIMPAKFTLVMQHVDISRTANYSRAAVKTDKTKIGNEV